MNRILTLLKYDYLQRVRSYNFLIILLVSLVFASLLIPEAEAVYSTVSIGDYLGHYNSAWIAYVTAVMSSVFISMLGYYIINSSIRTDQNNRLGQLVAATDISNFHYLIVKFLGNSLILLTTVICIFIVGIILFIVHNTGYPFEIHHFLLSYLLIPIPTIIFISALAILLEVIFRNKSVLQNTMFFILFITMIGQNWTGINGDPFGIQPVTQKMVQQVNEIDPSSESHGLNIGFVIRNKTLDKRFEFSSPDISIQFVLFRIFWLIIGVVIIYSISRLFHRFELNDRSVIPKFITDKKPTTNSYELQEIDLSSIPILDQSSNIWPVFKTELFMMIRKGKKWIWALNIIGMALLAITPLEMAHKIVLPILWFLQVHRWADLVTKEKFHQMHFFIYSSFRPVQRLLSAQFLAGTSLAVFLALPLMFRFVLLGDWVPVISILFGSVFIICLSTFIGIVSGGKRLFEIVFFFIAYLNVNALSFTDYFGGMHTSIGYLILLGGLAITLGALSFILRRLELRRM